MTCISQYRAWTRHGMHGMRTNPIRSIIRLVAATAREQLIHDLSLAGAVNGPTRSLLLPPSQSSTRYESTNSDTRRQTDGHTWPGSHSPLRPPRSRRFTRSHLNVPSSVNPTRSTVPARRFVLGVRKPLHAAHGPSPPWHSDLESE